ncbi:MAG: phosphoribosylaminoimidazolesuccinocarboxamide synthase [Acidimicrobiaceae bacterium]|nr:phosphoribosylaminoimidazolesuccinocarboxamide synthase [Acidimicrobiaceae bacterium]
MSETLPSFSADTLTAFAGIPAEMLNEVGKLVSFRRGKVRDVIDLGDRLVLVATDRLSAFDWVLGLVPHRGQILNQLSAWWFEKLSDIVASHILQVPDANVAVVKKCDPLLVEVVVRGRLTGSTSTAIWTRYKSGERNIYGIDFPDGMKKNDLLPRPIVTPTTKATEGHDKPISEDRIVATGLVEADLWHEVRNISLALFERGQKIAGTAGLVLVDTKYEFGIDVNGQLTLIDEVHTPDSSRYWRRSTLQQRLQAGLEPENLDKELVRLAYAAQGYTGQGPPEPLSPELATEASVAYRRVFEVLTGEQLQPASYPANPRVDAVLKELVC